MRILIQRVTRASVSIDKKLHSSISEGMLILVGVEESDNDQDIIWLCNKIMNLRIFNDESGIMNLSAKDLRKEILVVSQFTLFASTQKGNRPSYIRSARPELANSLYHKFISTLKNLSELLIQEGVFGANMQIELVNDGPVTIIIDSKRRE